MLEFIRPDKPTQNAFVERFKRAYSKEILDFYLFRTLNEAREINYRALAEYNSERPTNLTPEEYRLMAVRGVKKGVLTGNIALLVWFAKKSDYGLEQMK